MSAPSPPWSLLGRWRRTISSATPSCGASGPGRCRASTTPAAYLRRAVVHEAANHRRRLGRARRAQARVEAGLATAASDAYPSDLAPLDELEPSARAVLYLHEVEGWSFAEIAGQLEMSEANARQVASRARRRLRDLMGDVS